MVEYAGGGWWRNLSRAPAGQQEVTEPLAFYFLKTFLGLSLSIGHLHSCCFGIYKNQNTAILSGTFVKLRCRGFDLFVNSAPPNIAIKGFYVIKDLKRNVLKN